MPNTLKIIFLDIDGVLNTSETVSNNIYLDWERVKLLDEVCEKTGAALVLSSAWRIMHSRDNIDFALRQVGLFHGRIIGETINLRPDDEIEGQRRGQEIQHYLDKHKPYRFVIVDDSSDMMPKQLPWFVKTTFEHGLDQRRADRMVEILNGPKNPGKVKVKKIRNKDWENR